MRDGEKSVNKNMIFTGLSQKHMFCPGRYQRLQHKQGQTQKGRCVGFLKIGDPQFSMGFNTKSWSNDLDGLGVPPMT